MKKFLFTLVILIFTLSSNSYGQWIVQQIPPGLTINDVRFINKSTGWLCGDTRIFKTTNSGTNWIEQSNPAQSIIFQIHPVNERVVYAAGYCTILKTTNGGENWIGIRIGSLPCSQLPLLRGLWFINENTGWFCGDGYVIRTTDGCNTITDSTAVPDVLFDIHFKDSVTGIASSGARTFRTTSSGLNWYEVPLPHGFVVPNNFRLSFVGNMGWTAGTNNVIWKTTNYGISWDSLAFIQTSINQRTYSIEFSSSLTGYAGCTQGKIFKSTNGGIIWNEESTIQFGNATYYSIYTHNDSIVWAVGGISKILYTISGGGITQIEKTSSTFTKQYNLYQNYPNPFNPTTNIQYDLPLDNFVSIKIYNALGKEVMTLVDEFKNAGSYVISFNGTKLPSGIYYYQIKTESFSQTRQMILLK